MKSNQLDAILFDLDGTLLDTAPDLISAANHALTNAGFPAIDPLASRPLISRGGRRILMSGVKDQNDEQLLDTLLANMLRHYDDHIAEQTSFFHGMEEILEKIESVGLPWGIVTNKREHFTHRLLSELGLENRAACVVCGDTTAHAKPHPAPLTEAARRLQKSANNCLFIGDSPLDIEAGLRANMDTLVASYGYVPPEENPRNWGACGVISSPTELESWLPIS